MASAFETFSVKTARRNEMIDITSEVQVAVAKSGIDDGIVTVFCPHTTAGITINENADPDVISDLLMTFDKLVPKDPKYRHSEGNSDSHAKSSLVGASETLCVQHGRIKLGTWQGVYFCEFDGPRTRTVQVTVIG